MENKIIFGLASTLLVSALAFAEETKKEEKKEAKKEESKVVTAVTDIGVGNGGVSLAVGPAIKIVPGLKIVGQVEGAGDLQWQKQQAFLQSYEVPKFSPSLGASVGPVLSLGILHINPLIGYKCEWASDAVPQEKQGEYGCAARAGGKLFLGKSNGVQVGVGWTRALTDVTHGEKDQVDFMIRIPLSSNDEDRGINRKGDLDFDNDKSEIREKASGTVNA